MAGCASHWAAECCATNKLYPGAHFGFPARSNLYERDRLEEIFDMQFKLEAKDFAGKLILFMKYRRCLIQYLWGQRQVLST